MKRSYADIAKTFIFILIIVHNIGFSQTIPTFEDEAELEMISESAESTPDFSDLTDDYKSLHDHPINLNKTTSEELHTIHFLTESQIKNILDYIKTYGEMVSVFEIGVIPGLDSVTIRKIQPFITVLPVDEIHPLTLRNLTKYGKNQLFLRYQQVLQRQKGYCADDSMLKKNPNAGYLGSQQGYYFRYTYDYYGRAGMGFSGTKGPGEEFFKGSEPYGMDYYSGYIFVRKLKFLKTLIIGNYRVDFGQGLTMSSGLSTGSVMTSGNIKRYAGGIRPTLAMNGGSYLRGLAASAAFGRVTISLFYSNHKRDGNITSIDTASGEAINISSLSGTGYHRLPRELADKNSVKETILGGNVNFRNDFMSIGLTAYRSHWSASLLPKIYPYNQFNFSGNENLNAGIDFQFLYRNVYFFGEGSHSHNGGITGLLGFLANPDPAVTFSLIYRNYQRNYQNLLSNATGQNTGNANETGFMVNLNAHIFSGLSISGYADLFSFPWLKYRTDFLSDGSEYRVQADYSLGNTLMYLRFRLKEKQLNGTGDTGYLHTAVTNKSISLRYHIGFPVTPCLMMQSKVEVVRNHPGNLENHFGYLVSQNISWKAEKWPVTAALLYALFDTYSYDERIYSYENDVLYGYSVPAYEGKGIRAAFLLTCSFVKHIDLWCRYAMTWYNDRCTIGAGLEEIDGNVKSEVKVQVRFRF
ncbi:MAG: helix-hairpin-helix domain-containing protein [Bacteroidetes bacterium]|nr:helix-hairpin-helix domain-containing protein [Bacteroidota bacterium]